jgi:TolB-like protein
VFHGAHGAATSPSRAHSDVRSGLPSDQHAEASRKRPRIPALAVETFAATGPSAQLGPGLSSMLTTEFTKVEKPFKPIVVEWERRADLLRERELQKSPQVDPSTRVKGELLEPDVFVRGTVNTTDKGASWNIRLVDAQSAAILGTDYGKADGADQVFKAPAGIASRLVTQLYGSWQKILKDEARAAQSPR